MGEMWSLSQSNYNWVKYNWELWKFKEQFFKVYYSIFNMDFLIYKVSSTEHIKLETIQVHFWSLMFYCKILLKCIDHKTHVFCLKTKLN